MKGRSRRAMLAALVLPVLLFAGLSLSSPQSAYATTDAPTVTTPAVVAYDFPGGGLISLYQTEATVFDNPEGCGVLSYQWQLNDFSTPDTWDNYGDATTSAETLDIVFCFEEYDKVRLSTTLTNSAGFATDVSNVNWLCE